MLKIAICDDEQRIHDSLEDLLLNASVQMNWDYQAKHFHTAEELLNAPFDYNILFLDIMLDHDNDGLELGKKLRSMNNHALYIIMTSREDMYAEAFEATTFRYLLKPLTLEKVDKVMREAWEHLFGFGDYIQVVYRKKTHFIYVKDIIFIESYMRKRFIVTKNASCPTGEKLETLMERLENNPCFTQIGKSYFVNMLHIQSTTATSIIMNNGKVINLTKHGQEKFQKEFNRFLSRQGGT